MFKEYIRSGFRVLLKNKTSSIINIAGLSLGIASSLILFVVMKFELGYDTFHSNYNQIYRITTISQQAEGERYESGIYYPMARVLRNDNPDIAPVSMFRFNESGTLSILRNGDKELYKQKDIAFAEQEFLSIFDFDFVQGNPEKMLQDPGSVIISQSIADKYFMGDAMGKEVTLERKLTATITGVFKDFPENTDLPMKLIFRFDDLEKLDQFYSKDQWNVISSNVNCFFIKPEKVLAADLAGKITKTITKYKEIKDTQVYLQPLKDIHFDGRFETMTKRQFSRELIAALAIIGIILILTACINFINLSTAQSIKRARETGIRKVLGSSKIQLALKYLLETGIITLVSILFSLGIAELSVNQFKDFIELEKDLSLFNQSYVYTYLAVIFFAVTLISGIYPAVIISRYSPSEALKKNIGSAKSGFWSFRKGLVLVQFIISQLLIVSAIIVLNQIKYFSSRPLGFNEDQVITVPLPANNDESGAREVFRNTSLTNPLIKDVSYAIGSPLSGNNFDSHFKLSKNEEEDHPTDLKTIDEHYLKMYDLKLLAGRNIQPSDSQNRIMINRKLLDVLKLTDPREAVGKQIFLWGNYREIIGVVDDFHNRSFKVESGNVILVYFPRFFFEAGIKVNLPQGQSYQAMIDFLKEKWAEAFPGYYFDYEFLDDQIQKQYENETRLGGLVNIFTTIAIIISSLGLYGLIIFMTNRKTKEIGVRKTLGASVIQIIKLFITEFVILLIIAAVLAAPASYYIMDTWLSNFAYRINISIWIFGLAFLLSLLVSILTVGFRSYKAATGNPVNALRNE